MNPEEHQYERITVSPEILQIRADYMYLLKSLEADGIPVDTADGFDKAFVLLDRAYQIARPDVIVGSLNSDNPETPTNPPDSPSAPSSSPDG